MSRTNGYGTAEYRSLRDAPAAVPASSEEPLLPKATIRQYLLGDVDPSWADLILLLCYTITGLLDSAAISIWGSFVSMQTGNTVYFALGLVSPDDASMKWARSGVSIASFCAGSLLFSRFHRIFSPRRRWVLCVSFALQMACIVAAAVIVVVHHRRLVSPLHWTVIVPLALVAFQSSGQAVTSRALEYNSLTSVVLTSIYCDLFSDPKLFAMQNVERNRRAAAPVCLLVGALCGALWAQSSVGLAGALWTAALFKAVIVLAWLVWREGESTLIT
ncbi:hypothetical protein VTN77DRAFT_2201 [Rasamsonia byssochlamydoides]|uniref:uncharacterized protein n=1 Tax=Rasamsonia byssochlamydoides TaxID=89139 RepID=UPI003742A986